MGGSRGEGAETGTGAGGMGQRAPPRYIQRNFEDADIGALPVGELELR
jgi:hypothetical protein